MAAAITVITAICAVPARAVDNIAPMVWTPRPDWIVVTGTFTYNGVNYHAVGDGITDDTAAIQAALDITSTTGTTVLNGRSIVSRAVHLPAGTYRITNTLHWKGFYGGLFVGCGANTTIRWDGASGSAMFWSDGATSARFIGVSWDGNNLASCAYQHMPHTTYYETRCRHENEAFRNFTVNGTYMPTVTLPPAAIICGISVVVSGSETGMTNAPTAEMQVTNCLFKNCTNGLMIGYNAANEVQWVVDGCEFQDNGTGISVPVGMAHVLNTHFQNSSVADISAAGGHHMQIRRCTSQNSKVFFQTLDGPAANNMVEDCWVDHWTGNLGAIYIKNPGPNMITDCKFSNPVDTTTPAIRLGNSIMHAVTLSGNYCSNPSQALVTSGSYTSLVNIPGGGRTPTLTLLTSPTTTFLSTGAPYIGDGSTTVPILDVTGTNFAGGAKGTGRFYSNVWYGDDDHDALQAAIDQAKLNNNGSIVYLPTIKWSDTTGKGYRINSTLAVTGSNYTIESGGIGSSYIMWGGSTTSGTMMTIASPKNIALKNLYFMSGTAAFVSGTQVGPAPQTAILVSSTTACSLDIDGIALRNASPGTYPAGNGLVLSGLPAGSLVNMGQVFIPLVTQDCGQAEILIKHLLGVFSIKAPNTANAAKSGFLGIQVAQQDRGTITSQDWNMTIDDNQDLVIGSYYNDNDANHLLIRSGNASASTTGRVTIQGVKEGRGIAGSGYTPVLLNIDNYNGSVMYSSQNFCYSLINPPIQHTGTNPLNLVLANNRWQNYLSSITEAGSGLNLIEAQSCLFTSSTTQWISNTLPTSYGQVFAKCQDHLRTMAWEDLRLRYGIENLVTNGAVESDTPNPTPTTTSGYTPSGWTVANATTAGSGVRNFTVVSGTYGGSPFASGSQSMLWLDTTGTNTGSTLNVTRTFTAAQPSEGAVYTFDFRVNSTGATTDFWIRSGTPSTWTSAVHITYGRLSAGVGGSDTFLGTFSLDTWYRARVLIPAPNSGNFNATLQLTPWTVTGAGSTTSYTIDAARSIQTSGFSKLNMTSGAAPGSSQSLNLDNVSLITGDPQVP